MNKFIKFIFILLGLFFGLLGLILLLGAFSEENNKSIFLVISAVFLFIAFLCFSKIKKNKNNQVDDKDSQAVKKTKNKKVQMFLLALIVIMCFAMVANRSEQDTEQISRINQASSLKALQKEQNKKIKKIKNEYVDKLTLMYIKYYPNYSPVRCNGINYKGYLFIKCFKSVPGADGRYGGLWVVDDVNTNAEGAYDVYAVNGKAMSQREAMFRNAGREYVDIKVIPLPMVEWIKIDEVNELAAKSKDYKEEYKKESLFKK